MLEIELTKDAEEDILDSYFWYNNELAGLGEDFLSLLDTTFHNISVNLKQGPILVNNIRRKFIKKYPFTIFYEVLGNKIVVYGVIHMSRNPEILINRLSGQV